MYALKYMQYTLISLSILNKLAKTTKFKAENKLENRSSEKMRLKELWAYSSVHHPSASGASDSFCNIVGETSYINEMEISNIAFFRIVNEKKCSIIYSLKKKKKRCMKTFRRNMSVLLLFYSYLTGELPRVAPYIHIFSV